MTSHKTISIFGLSILTSCVSPYVDPAQKGEVNRIITTQAEIPKGWIKKITTVDEIESNNLIYTLNEPGAGVPFKRRAKEWADFKARFTEGSTLWYWESPRYGNPDSYEQYHGFLIKNGNRVVATFYNCWSINYIER